MSTDTRTEADPEMGTGAWTSDSDPLGILAVGPELEWNMAPPGACIVWCRHPIAGRLKHRCPSCQRRVLVAAKPRISRLAWIISYIRRGRSDADRLLAWLENRPEPGLVTVEIGAICRGESLIEARGRH